MQKTVPSDRKLLSILLFLCLIPVLSGGARFFSMARNGAGDPENLNYLSDPLPIAVHMIAYAVFCVFGAFQIAPVFRARHLKLHRFLGRALLPIGIAAAGSGIWMTLSYPPGNQQWRNHWLCTHRFWRWHDPLLNAWISHHSAT